MPQIDRSFPGFGDFTLAGRRGVEAGRPGRGLLYHALASPTVVADRSGKELRGFPTLAEIEAVENYVYGVSPPSLDDIQQRAANGQPLGMVVFAPQYQSAPMSVHSRRAGCASREPASHDWAPCRHSYDAKARNFVALDDAQRLRVQGHPGRFSAYLAVQMPGSSEHPSNHRTRFRDDKDLAFRVPLHKLFGGRAVPCRP